MSDLKQQLMEAGVACRDLALFSKTDRGEVLFFTAAGGDGAIKLWEKLRGMAGATGHWPVLLGDANKISGWRAIGRKNEQSVVETLKYAQTIAMPEWFSKFQQERMAAFGIEADVDTEELLAVDGEWPSSSMPRSEFSTPFDIISKKPLARLGVALVPTKSPWEVAAFLGLGNWNDCPEAAVHCAVHRYWERQHGAVMVAARWDVIEMKVDRPARTREKALSLAREQYVYCYDIVEQGMDTIANLAAVLLRGTSWYFWWD